MENEAAEAENAKPASSETLVLDEDATEYHEHLHVHFAPGQLSLGAHHIGDYMPQHQDPSRSKRGSFAPGHMNNLLGSSSSSNLLASSSLLRHASSSMRHSQSASISEDYRNANSSSSGTGAMQSELSWTLGSMHHNSHLQQRCNTPLYARMQQGSATKQRSTTPVHENRQVLLQSSLEAEIPLASTPVTPVEAKVHSPLLMLCPSLLAMPIEMTHRPTGTTRHSWHHTRGSQSTRSALQAHCQSCKKPAPEYRPKQQHQQGKAAAGA